MGLSNEERVAGLYWAINAIVKHGRYLHECLNEYRKSQYKYLFDSINNLWHNFLGNQRNSAHWIIGSSATGTIKWDDNTPWGRGIIYNCDEAKENDSDVFDAFDRFLDIPGLLGHADDEYRHVYTIYAWTEQAIYYLRRYDDDLSKRLEDLSKNISDIYGEFFSIFTGSQTYTCAYMLNKILKMIYGTGYPHNKDGMDAFTLYLQEEHIHHHINRMMRVREQSIDVLSEMYRKLYRANKAGKLTVMMRVEAMLKLCGRRFHYDHQFEKLAKILSKSDRVKARKLFEECKRLHEEYGKESHTGLSEMSIFGPMEE